MGNGIAHVAAQAGKEVRLIDLSGEVLERAVETINRNLDRQLEKQLIDEMQRDSTLARIQTYESLEAGVEDVELVVEAVAINCDKFGYAYAIVTREDLILPPIIEPTKE